MGMLVFYEAILTYFQELHWAKQVSLAIYAFLAGFDSRSS